MPTDESIAPAGHRQDMISRTLTSLLVIGPYEPPAQASAPVCFVCAWRADGKPTGGSGQHAGLGIHVRTAGAGGGRATCRANAQRHGTPRQRALTFMVKL